VLESFFKPDVVVSADLKKFLPIVDTRALLKKYSVDVKANVEPSNHLLSTSTSLDVDGKKRQKGKLSSSSSKASLRPTSFSDFRPRFIFRHCFVNDRIG
jgi:hypothetical protein